MEAIFERWMGVGPGFSELHDRDGQRFQRLSISRISHQAEASALGRSDSHGDKSGLSGSKSLPGNCALGSVGGRRIADGAKVPFPGWGVAHAGVASGSEFCHGRTEEEKR